MSEVTNIIQPAQLTFFFLIFLAVVNLILAIKCKIPLINFVVAIFTLGMAATTIGTTLLFQGYIQMFTMLTALLSLIQGIRDWRG